MPIFRTKYYYFSNIVKCLSFGLKEISCCLLENSEKGASSPISDVTGYFGQ